MRKPVRIGVGGPVGSGKTALLDGLCKAMRDRLELGVITNETAADFRYFGTALYFTDDAEAFACCLRVVLPHAAVDTPAPNLTIARIMATEGPAFHHCREVCMSTALSRAVPAL